MGKPIVGKETEGIWEIRHGRVRAKRRKNKARRVEALQYNNPYRYKIERMWFDGHVVCATEQGEVDVDPKKVKVAQEYQIVYAVRLTAGGKLARGKEPKRVPGQFNIYDSDYVANTLRSERDCLRSGYEIRRSMVFETLLTDRCCSPRSRALRQLSFFLQADATHGVMRKTSNPRAMSPAYT